MWILKYFFKAKTGEFVFQKSLFEFFQGTLNSEILKLKFEIERLTFEI